MNTRAIRYSLIGSLGVALALASGCALATSFRLTDLGTVGGTGSRGSAINASGEVTGFFETIDGLTHAFVWDGTTTQDLGTLGGSSSEGRAINASGQVTGFAATAGDEASHAFLWDGTTMQDLGTLGGSFSAGVDINDSGQVAGLSDTIDGDLHAFLWDGTTMQDLGTLGGSFSESVAINTSGQVTGRASPAGDEGFHAFLWDGTTMQDLGTLGGLNGIGNAINSSGQVTGSASTAPGDDVFHAFLWDGTTVQDLNALIDPADPLQPFVTLVGGVDINDLGQILANGFDSRTGEGHAYLVSPVPLTVPDLRAQLEALVEVVLSLNLKAGIGNALDSKLQNALATLDRVHQQDNGSPVGLLYAFIQSVEAQRGKALTTEQADQLVSAAQGVIDAL